jgi:hypothetical protein
LPPLRNPANDAHDVAEALGKLGFSVAPLYDGTRKQMNQAITAFRESLSSDRSSEGFFYYAGHGVQAKGVNYLIPVGADIRSEADLDDEAVNLQRVLGNIEEAQNRVNVIILDACRDNPLPASSRSAQRGLAVVASAPPESVVLFSTAQNQTAADGEGRNSPFAAALVKYLPEPGDITRTIKLITAEVKRATDSAQTPFQYTSLDFDYELNRGATSPKAAAAIPAPESAPTLTAMKSYGSLIISAADEGTLYLDGKSMGDLTAGGQARLDSVEVGERSLELRYANGHVERHDATVAAGTAENVAFSYRADVFRLPRAAIKIDGNFDEWNGILPIFTSGIGSPLAKDMAIDKVYLAVDEKNLYMRFDIKDATPRSFAHRHNFDSIHFSSYGLDLVNGDNHIYASVYHDPRSGWAAQMTALAGDVSNQIYRTSVDYAMSGQSLEVSFPLEQIKSALGALAAGGTYDVYARTGYHNNMSVGDRTAIKQFTF